MVIFFFLIGLEVREEFAIGSLRDRRRALVPLVAGLLGVAAPAVIYLLIAGGEAAQGWGVVIGTDTAFLLGALALVGPKMSNQLRVFLLTLDAVVAGVPGPQLLLDRREVLARDDEDDGAIHGSSVAAQGCASRWPY